MRDHLRSLRFVCIAIATLTVLGMGFGAFYFQNNTFCTVFPHVRT